MMVSFFWVHRKYLKLLAKETGGTRVLNTFSHNVARPFDGRCQKNAQEKSNIKRKVEKVKEKNKIIHATLKALKWSGWVTHLRHSADFSSFSSSSSS